MLIRRFPIFFCTCQPTTSYLVGSIVRRNHNDIKKSKLPPSTKRIVYTNKKTPVIVVKKSTNFSKDLQILTKRKSALDDKTKKKRVFEEKLPFPREAKLDISKRSKVLAKIDLQDDYIHVEKNVEFLKEDDYIIIYCHGTIIEENMGIGCWFGPDNPLNLAYKPQIIVPKNFGPHTERFAFLSHLISVKLGLQKLKNSHYYKNEPIRVKSQSFLLVKSIERGYQTFNFNGSFQELVKEIKYFMIRGMDVQFELIEEHMKASGRRSLMDVMGVTEARYLAQLAIKS